jgi:hypothetical protein
VVLDAHGHPVAVGVPGGGPAVVVEELDAGAHHAGRVGDRGRVLVLDGQRVADHRRAGLDRGIEHAVVIRRALIEGHAALEHARVRPGLGQARELQVPGERRGEAHPDLLHGTGIQVRGRVLDPDAHAGLFQIGAGGGAALVHERDGLGQHRRRHEGKGKHQQPQQAANGHRSSTKDEIKTLGCCFPE